MELLGRIPAGQLSRNQVELVAFVIGAVLLLMIAGAALDALLARGGSLWLRLTGRTPPRDTPTRVAIDELEARINKRGE